MKENIIVHHDIFYDGSTQEELQHIELLYPDKEILIQTVHPGEAHITVWNKEN